MNTRKSKQMLWFKKRVCKIIFSFLIFSFLSIVYQCKISDNTTAQYVEQKFAYISKNNESYGLPYSVEKMINTGGVLDNVQDRPEQAEKVEEEIFNITKEEKEEIAQWEQSFEEKMPWH